MNARKTTLPPHPYHGDGVPDFHGDDRCSICFLPRREPDDPMHDLEDTPPELAEVKARILGESHEDDERVG